MVKRLGEYERIIVIISFLAIMVLAIIGNFSPDQVMGARAIFFIILIALVNIIPHIYNNFRKREK